MSQKWNAHVIYGNGKLGTVSMFGCASRQHAIDWLHRGYGITPWSNAWYMQPAWWIEKSR